MSFTDGKPRVATEEETRFKWGFGKPGERFRCFLCGHKFKAGDYYRFQYTNDLPKYGGNPLICEKCDGPDVIEKWKVLVDEWKSDKFWWFRGRE